MKSQTLIFIQNAFFVLIFTAIFTSTYGAIYRVNINSPCTTGCDGSSWSKAFTDLQSALDAAGNFDEIWVAQGTYIPTVDPFGNATPADPRDKTFYIKSNVTIYGGFVGNETGSYQRNWELNETILSANGHYHAVICLYDNPQLNGFTISGGRATDFSFGHITINGFAVRRYAGGGIHGVNTSMRILNCSFIDNQALVGSSPSGGSAIFCLISPMTIHSCYFSDNSGETITIVATENTEIKKCHWTNNQICLANYESNTSVYECIFNGNQSNQETIINYASLASEVSGLMTLNIYNSLIAGNNNYNPVSQFGFAAIHNYRFTSPNENYGAITNLINCALSKNRGKQGGAIQNAEFCEVNATNCIFWANSGTVENEIFSTGTVTLDHCILSDGTPNNGSITYPPGVVDGGNNQDLDPQFVFLSPNNPPTATGDFHLRMTSPGINNGDNSANNRLYDLDGIERIKHIVIDLGAYEYSCPNGTNLDPVPDLQACMNFTLPPITGTNLSGQEAYYTGPNGTGIEYQVGDIISASGDLFVYSPGFCGDEINFRLDVFRNGAQKENILGGIITIWTNSSSWVPEGIPNPCDDVIVSPPTNLSHVGTTIGYCKTLEVKKGAVFSIGLGTVIHIGNLNN